MSSLFKLIPATGNVGIACCTGTAYPPATSSLALETCSRPLYLAGAADTDLAGAAELTTGAGAMYSTTGNGTAHTVGAGAA